MFEQKVILVYNAEIMNIMEYFLWDMNGNQTWLTRVSP
jgi:hypothetical protein